MNPERKRRFQRQVLSWACSVDRSFVWREPEAAPELILVSEMLLRKTKAERVDEIVRRLFDRYPDLEALSTADVEDLADLIRPLGLQNIRADALQTAAERITNDRDGEVPRDLSFLWDLPHVGRYAANAVLCFAFGEPRPIVDANVVRVLCRVFDRERPTEVHTDDELWELAEELVPSEQPKTYNWSLLDLGALLCTPRDPDCLSCPVVDLCEAHREGWCGCTDTEAKQN